MSLAHGGRSGAAPTGLTAPTIARDSVALSRNDHDVRTYSATVSRDVEYVEVAAIPTVADPGFQRGGLAWSALGAFSRRDHHDHDLCYGSR